MAIYNVSSFKTSFFLELNLGWHAEQMRRAALTNVLCFVKEGFLESGLIININHPVMVEMFSLLISEPGASKPAQVLRSSR